MATKSFVGRIEPDDTFTAHSVTYDGHPGGVGASLAALLTTSWARRRPSLVLAEMAGFRHWWSIGPGLDGPTRAGYPNQREHEQDIPMVTGSLGATFREQHQWGYLFRGEDELVVVKTGEWWQTPAYPLQRWAQIPIASIEAVDWTRLQQTGELRLHPETPQPTCPSTSRLASPRLSPRAARKDASG